MIVGHSFTVEPLLTSVTAKNGKLGHQISVAENKFI